MSVTSAALEPAAIGQSERTTRRLQRLASSAAIAAVLETFAILLLSARGDPRFQVGIDLVTFGFVSTTFLFPVVGALILQRRPFLRVAWLMLVIGLGLGLGLLGFGYGVIAMPAVHGGAGVSYSAAPLPVASLVLSQLLFLPSLASAATLLLLLFPTDRLISPRWRIVAVVGVVGAVLYQVGLVFAPGQLDPANVPGVLNPIAAPAGWGAALAQVETIGNVLVTAAVVAASLSLVVRYRRADRVETAQIRWIALLGVLTAPAFAIGSLQIDVVSDIFFGIGLALFSMMPLAIGIAITRYRLYDIDRLINRTLVYGLLTAILAGVFTAGIGFAQRLFIATTGQSSDAAVVAATLVVATLYAPLRKRLENLVDRRFKYEQQRFGAYREQIAGVLTIIEPGRAAQRLVEEAVRELQATGGAILTSTGSETATSGRWPVAPIVRLPIPGGNARMATIVVGPRVDGQPHDPPTVAQLEEMASLVGAAVRLAGGVRTETGR